MCREDDLRLGSSRVGSIDVVALLGSGILGRKAEPCQFCEKELADGSFIASDGFNVDEFAGEFESLFGSHGKRIQQLAPGTEHLVPGIRKFTRSLRKPEHSAISGYNEFGGKCVAGEIKSLMLNGPVGQLEALLNVGEPNATHAALICHPHPLFGGTMHNKVVYNAMKSLTKFGFHALRFNFRGTGLSGGTHDEGRGEREDVRAALIFWKMNFICRSFSRISFGAATGLKAACNDPRIVGLISLGTPVSVEGRLYAYQFLSQCMQPKLFVSGSQDQYSPEPQLRDVVGNAAEPKKLVMVEGGDHFFVGKLELMQQAIESWVKDTFKVSELSGVR